MQSQRNNCLKQYKKKRKTENCKPQTCKSKTQDKWQDKKLYYKKNNSIVHRACSAFERGAHTTSIYTASGQIQHLTGSAFYAEALGLYRALSVQKHRRFWSGHMHGTEVTKFKNVNTSDCNGKLVKNKTYYFRSRIYTDSRILIRPFGTITFDGVGWLKLPGCFASIY